MEYLWLSTSRDVALPHTLLERILFAAMLGGHLSLGGVPSASARSLPLQAVIHGHHVQPRESQLQAIGHPDVTAAEAAEIDKIYQELQRCRASICTAQTHPGDPGDQ
jgi:hypothetical protein